MDTVRRGEVVLRIRTLLPKAPAPVSSVTHEPGVRSESSQLSRRRGRVMRYGATEDRAGFEAAIDADPTDSNTHAVYADWLDENGEHDEAAFRRAMGDWHRRLSPELGFPYVPLGQSGVVGVTPDRVRYRWKIAKVHGYPEGVNPRHIPVGRQLMDQPDVISTDPSVAYANHGHSWDTYRGMEAGLRRAFMAVRNPEPPPVGPDDIDHNAPMGKPYRTSRREPVESSGSDRAKIAHELRESGKKLHEIAAELGISKQRAAQLVSGYRLHIVKPPKPVKEPEVVSPPIHKSGTVPSGYETYEDFRNHVKGLGRTGLNRSEIMSQTGGTRREIMGILKTITKRRSKGRPSNTERSYPKSVGNYPVPSDSSQLSRRGAVTRYSVAPDSFRDETVSALAGAAARGDDTALGALGDRLGDTGHPAADVVHRALRGEGVEGDPHAQSTLGMMHAVEPDGHGFDTTYHISLPHGFENEGVGTGTLSYYHLPTGHYWHLNLFNGPPGAEGSHERSWLIPTTPEEVHDHVSRLGPDEKREANSIASATTGTPQDRDFYEERLRDAGVHPDQLPPVDTELVPGPDEVDHNVPIGKSSHLSRRRYAAYRAPAGGMIARGTAYKGGELIPDMTGDFMNPSPKPIRKSECASPPSSPNDPVTVRKRKFDPAKLAALKAKFAKPLVVAYRRGQVRRHSGRSLFDSERAKRSHDMRLSGSSFPEIAKELGVTRQRAAQLVAAHQNRLNEPQTTEPEPVSEIKPKRSAGRPSKGVPPGYETVEEFENHVKGLARTGLSRTEIVNLTGGTQRSVEELLKTVNRPRRGSKGVSPDVVTPSEVFGYPVASSSSHLSRRRSAVTRYDKKRDTGEALRELAFKLNDELDIGPDYQRLFWNPETKVAWYVTGDGDEEVEVKKVRDALENVPGVDHVRVEAEYFPPETGDWVEMYDRNDPDEGWKPWPPPVKKSRQRSTVTRYGADHATVDTLLHQLQQPEHDEHRWGLDDPVNGHRGITADALDDVGRGDEAELLRRPNTHVMVHEGRVVPARFTDAHVRGREEAVDRHLRMMTRGGYNPTHGFGFVHGEGNDPSTIIDSPLGEQTQHVSELGRNLADHIDGSVNDDIGDWMEPDEQNAIPQRHWTELDRRLNALRTAPYEEPVPPPRRTAGMPEQLSRTRLRRHNLSRDT